MALQRPAHRPLIVGHRGMLSEQFPQNSLPAFQAALELGADGVECDVRLGDDGQLFCVHDRQVSGVRPEGLNAQQRKQHSIPLLAEVLELMKGYPGKGLWVEAKTWSAAEEIFRQLKPSENKVLISFSDQVAHASLQNGWDTVLLDDTGGPDVVRDRSHPGTRFGPSASLAFCLTDEELSQASVWTVNDLHIARLLDERGVWALTTDYPGQLLALFG